MHTNLEGLLKTVLIGGLVLFVLYRRFRRNIGRQKLRVTVMWIRSAILTLVCVLLLVSPFITSASFLAAGIGAAIGIGLALYALMHTRLEFTPEGRFYTPNPYIGMGVTALLIGRLVYRFTVVYPALHTAMRQAAQNPQLQSSPLAAYQRSPLTLGIYFLLAGYYVGYYVSVIIKSRALKQTDITPVDTGS